MLFAIDVIKTSYVFIKESLHMNQKKTRAIVLFIAALLLCAITVYQLAFTFYLKQETSKTRTRLSLYKTTLINEVERFSHLPYLFARDPLVRSQLQTGGTEQLNKRFQEFSEQLGLSALYLMDTNGLTIASSNFDQEKSFIGKNYGFRPYFQQALSGSRGYFYGVGVTSKKPGYFIAEPVVDDSGQTLGVVAIKIDLTRLENNWHNSGELILVANRDGIILLVSEDQWRYHRLDPLSNERLTEIRSQRQFAGIAFNPLGMIQLTAENVRLQAKDYLYLSDEIGHSQWRLHLLADMGSVRTRSWLVLIGCIFVLVVGLSLFLVWRNSKIGAALRHSVQQEGSLRQKNIMLAEEIEERKRAERTLEQTRNELALASRLAALGELAASVSHELGQPLSAMKNILVASELSAPQNQVQADTIYPLVDRMENITKQLKFFARQDDSTELMQISLASAIVSALSLMQTDFVSAGIDIRQKLHTEEICVQGNQLRLEQVLINLLRNALNALGGRDEPQIEIELHREGDHGIVSISDNGSGIGDSDMKQLQQPFYTTRASGMGLGLSISTKIVHEHKGKLTVTNRQQGGTIFEIHLPIYNHKEV